MRKEAKKNKKKLKKNNKYNYEDDDSKYIFPDANNKGLSPVQNGNNNHRRTDSQSSYDPPESPSDFKGGGDSPSFGKRNTTTPRFQPNDIFSTNKTTTERYAGSEDIEDHAAMELIIIAEEYEKNDDLLSAQINHKNAIKQFNTTVHEIDNNKIKRKWREKINDYEIQLLRITRKVKLREKISGNKMRKKHQRANTLAVTKKSR
eukprot:209393_1